MPIVSNFDQHFYIFTKKVKTWKRIFLSYIDIWLKFKLFTMKYEKNHLTNLKSTLRYPNYDFKTENS
ncbi:hypothetical protein BpHYR1_015349 [Brachionus plicatilis]|uniref:Uncharacterized protein n=1 Tax=Brachionus plicatilis TaxID=10195 RepID=A0A3M7T5D6_BRAPC|nr:hypothetical protein BpHYR1_015349 [Brachionus plicatilis]